MGARIYNPRKGLPDKKRATASDRGYGHQWKIDRDAHIAANPLCEMCMKDGRLTPSTQSDHIVPRRRGGSEFWSNRQALCASCHSKKTMKELRNG